MVQIFPTFLYYIIKKVKQKVFVCFEIHLSLQNVLPCTNKNLILLAKLVFRKQALILPRHHGIPVVSAGNPVNEL